MLIKKLSVIQDPIRSSYYDGSLVNYSVEANRRGTTAEIWIFGHQKMLKWRDFCLFLTILSIWRDFWSFCHSLVYSFPRLFVSTAYVNTRGYDEGNIKKLPHIMSLIILKANFIFYSGELQNSRKSVILGNVYGSPCHLVNVIN